MVFTYITERKKRSMSKKGVVFMLAILALVIVSGGCGGGSSSLPTSERNPQSGVLEEVFDDGTEVTMVVVWDGNPYELKFRNIGNGKQIGDFECINSQDLPFVATMSYGTEAVSALFTDKEFDDIYLFFIVNVTNATYYDEYSMVLSQIWKRSDYIKSFAVNGVEILENLHYDFNHEQLIVKRFTLKDVLVDKGVLTVNFTKGHEDYHYVWRHIRDNMEFVSIDDYNATDLSSFSLSYCREGFEAVFVDDNLGEWIIIIFNPDNSTYRVETNVAELDNIGVFVNGENITDNLTVEPSRITSGLADVLIKGSILSMEVMWKGELRTFDFMSKGDGEFMAVQNSAIAEMSLMGSMLLAHFAEGKEDNEDMTILLYLDEDSYKTVLSSSNGDGLVELSVNGKDVTSLLTNEDESSQE